MSNIGPINSQERNDQAAQAFFERQASSYSDFYKKETRTGAAQLFQIRLALSVDMMAGRGGALLDCASGTGEITRAVALASHWDHVFVNDFSPAMSARCQEVMADIPIETHVIWNVGNIFDLKESLGNRRFDAVLCLGLIAHCGRLPDLLRDIWGILNEDGVLLLQSSLLDHPGHFITKAVAQSIHRTREYRVFGFYLSTILSEAERTGFELVDIRRFGLCFPFGDRIFAGLNHRLERLFALKLNRNGGEALLLFKKR